METMINTYTCSEGHVMVTIEKVKGVTPMMLHCENINFGTLSTCNQMAKSAWYRCDQNLEPTHAWFKPEPGQKLSKLEKEHCDQGGLLLNKIGEALAPVHAPKVKAIGRNEQCPCGGG